MDLFSLRASDLVMKVDALLSAVPKGEIRRDVSFKDTQRYALFVYHSYFFENIPQWKSERWNSLLSVLQLSPRENEVFYDVVAIIDPLTREAQKISSLLIVRHSPVLLLFSQSARKQQAGWVKQHVEFSTTPIRVVDFLQQLNKFDLSQLDILQFPFWLYEPELFFGGCLLFEQLFCDV